MVRKRLHPQTCNYTRRWLVMMVLCLAAWWTVLPVLSPLHLAFSNHGHYYCMQHHRYEDSPSKPESVFNRIEPSSAMPGITGQAQVKAGGHLDCPLSNLILGNHAVAGEPISFTTVDGDYSDPGGNHQLAIRPPSVLSRAPKHSPPC